MDFSELKGKTLTAIDGGVGSEEVVFTVDDGSKYKMYHSQDCCEHVRVEDVVGELDDLIGSPILLASETSNLDNPPEYADSWTWTFYNLSTNRGSVTFRWLGESNGYYGEEVDFCKLPAS